MSSGKSKKEGAWKLYTYNYETGEVKLKNKKCPRCREKIMAHHLNPERWSCGGCGYTEYYIEKRRR
ncbi:MAG: 30S ribosomal protein S27ae [Candidatus Bathyarchaeota archaeon]|nr:30S ribosomal protein S27ae [Candidatus Bathyarchaeota archaeon]